MSEKIEEHPLFAALEPKNNKYLGMKKNNLLKLCKEAKIDAERDDNDEDLAFLLYRLDENRKMTAEEVTGALEDLGIKTAHNKDHNLLLMVTYELALIDLIEADQEEIDELVSEFELETADKEREELIVEICVSIVNQ